MDYEITTRYVEANGLTFEVLCCGDGDKFAMCLHGFPEHAHSWRAQLLLLAKMGYTAWAPNLRGYGKTSRPIGKKAYEFEHLVKDVAELMDAAGAESTLLIAHDWGGAVAWDFALRKVRPLAGLIVMNIPHPLRFAEGLKTFRQLIKSWYIIFFQIPKLPEWLLGRNKARGIGDVFLKMAVDKNRFPKELLDFYCEQASQPGALTAMVNYYRANIPPTNRDEQLKVWSTPLDTPTLMIWGESDAALGKELTYGTEKLVNNFKVVYLPKVSHWVQQEAPESVNAIMEAWLENRPLPAIDERGQVLT